jgi:hypothetical protein
VADLLLETGLATTQNRVGRREPDASGATPDIAGLGETYNIAAVDWAVVDASGTLEPALRRCESRIGHAKKEQAG